jgi:hypothetical protein
MWISFGGMLLFFWFAGGVIFPAAIDAVNGVTGAVWSLLGF